MPQILAAPHGTPPIESRSASIGGPVSVTRTRGTRTRAKEIRAAPCVVHLRLISGGGCPLRGQSPPPGPYARHVRRAERKYPLETHLRKSFFKYAGFGYL